MLDPLLTEIYSTHQKKVDALSACENFYDYEKKFCALHTELGNSLLAYQLSKQSRENERKKKSLPDTGK